MKVSGRSAKLLVNLSCSRWTRAGFLGLIMSKRKIKTVGIAAEKKRFSIIYPRLAPGMQVRSAGSLPWYTRVLLILGGLTHVRQCAVVGLA
jgi:hypothetical protein